MGKRLPPFFCLIFFSIAACLQNRLEASDTKHGTYLNPPPEQIEHFAFGFPESLADGLWIRWIQDGDTCQTYAGTSRAPSIEGENNEFFNPRHRVCDSSWSFKMLDATTRLAPRFAMPYKLGAMTLAVLVEDYEGASHLFERALTNFPNDWEILYRAGYHFLFDMKDVGRAADLMKRAADNGAPQWVNLLAARLFSRAGRTLMGIATLKTYLAALTEPEQRKHVEERIAELQKQLKRLPAAAP